MKVKMSFQERLMRAILINEKIYVNGVLETINDVQFEPKTRQVIFGTASGKSFTAFKDDMFEWELDQDKPRFKPQNGRVKGKDK